MSFLEVRRGDIYTKYGLDSVVFDSLQFEDEWGERLRQAGYSNMSADIIAEAHNREYLSSQMTDDTVAAVNEGETLVSAKNAEEFQHKVSTVRIRESFERLVDLRTCREADEGTWTFTKGKYHEACGEWAGRDKLFLVRESVSSRLSQLALSLSHIDTKINFEDGFRPLGVQEGLFIRRIAMAKASHPEWTDEELLLEARSKTAYTPRFAAHKAGAAVDVRLYSASSGDFYDIGHDYPDGGEIVRLNTEFVTQHQWQNRKILEHMARASGLFMYPYEDWHLCYGDATAAVVGSPCADDYTAKYGPVKLYDSKRGKIQATYDQDELDEVFPFTAREM